MASAAKSFPSNPLNGPPNRSRGHAKSNLSRTVNGDDAWDLGSAYHKLDSDFLQRPLIPRAPATPRLRIDRVDGSLRVVDPVDDAEHLDIPETVSFPRISLLQGSLPFARKPFVVPALSILFGFLAGLVAALILGWL